jgi:hypothetical protein
VGERVHRQGAQLFTAVLAHTLQGVSDRGAQTGGHFLWRGDGTAFQSVCMSDGELRTHGKIDGLPQCKQNVPSDRT